MKQLIIALVSLLLLSACAGEPEATEEVSMPIEQQSLSSIVEEGLENFAGLAHISIHAVLADGTIAWANKTELDFLGYQPADYIGKKIQDFHQDPGVIAEILGTLSGGHGLSAYPARLRAADGTTRYVLINSNVHFSKTGEFISTRCFSTGVTEPIYRAAKAALVTP